LNYGSSGILTRNAVSLAQLPPPIEADAEEQSSDMYVPPPPEFNADGTRISNSNMEPDELVFAPPPQFCDGNRTQQQQQQQHQQQYQQHQQQRVKIIGVIPKAVNNINKIKSQSNHLHNQ
jgi:hypothetical protein